MKVFKEDFDLLWFFEAPHFGEAIFHDNCLGIPVNDLLAGDKHPIYLFPENRTLLKRDVSLGNVIKGVMLFRSVFFSRREVSEYTRAEYGENLYSGFKEAYAVEDVHKDITELGVSAYQFEGRIANPAAHVDWIVIAKSFELQVEE
jgi:hypothetical protein